MHEIADPLLIAANEVVRYFEEYENGDIPECAFMQASAEPFRVIQNCWQKMSNLPIPSDRLKVWVDGYDCLTASIDNMRVVYTSQEFANREENNRKACMRGIVRSYRDDLQKVIDIENQLKKSHVL